MAVGMACYLVEEVLEDDLPRQYRVENWMYRLALH